MAKKLSGPLTDLGQIADVRDFFLDFPLSWDPDYLRVMYDFAEVDDDQTNLWTVVKDSGASVGITADTAFGYLNLTSTATTENDGASIQQNEIWLPAAGKDIWFETKLQIVDADQIDCFVGLCENFATNPENILAAAERIGFQIDDGNASILSKTEADTVETSKDTEIDAVDNTDIVLGFHVIGASSVEFFVNRVWVSSHTTNIDSDEEMTIGFGQISGVATGTQIMSIDYIMCVQKR